MDSEAEQCVRYEIVAPHVAAITLDRPQSANALTAVMWRRVGELAAKCESDSSVRVVVFRGSGRFFCPGVDLKHTNIADNPAGPPPVDFRSYFYGPLLNLSKPSLACINGPAAGGGLGLALACDMRFASESAKFSTAFGKIGVTAHDMVAWLLPRVVGIPKALELLYTARAISAAEALDVGLVTAVFSESDLEARVLEVAGNIAQLAPQAIRLSKRLIVESPGRSAEAHMLAQEYAAMANRSVAGSDIAEGVAAFKEKRKPKFRGPEL